MSYTHLTAGERYHIDELLRQGFAQSAIAKALSRSASSISRELRRNKGKRGWRPHQANEKAKEKLIARGKGNASKVDESAWDYALDKLKTAQWSPEQINGRLKKEKLPLISHESIYQRILADKRSGGHLYKHLRCKKKRRNRYGAKTAGRGCIPNRIDIEERPAIVDSRKRVGDWEGDTVIGSHDGGAVIATMVERKSRFLVVSKAKNKTTKAVIGGIIEQMKPLSALVETITFDNGKEFSSHHKLKESLGSNIFFAKPYHSWERGLNENTNGLLRQYFPKKTGFDNISELEFHRAAKKLNNRPRKCLGYATPLEVFTKLAAKKGIALRI